MNKAVLVLSLIMAAFVVCTIGSAVTQILAAKQLRRDNTTTAATAVLRDVNLGHLAGNMTARRLADNHTLGFKQGDIGEVTPNFDLKSQRVTAALNASNIAKIEGSKVTHSLDAGRLASPNSLETGILAPLGDKLDNVHEDELTTIVIPEALTDREMSSVNMVSNEHQTFNIEEDTTLVNLESSYTLKVNGQEIKLTTNDDRNLMSIRPDHMPIQNERHFPSQNTPKTLYDRVEDASASNSDSDDEISDEGIHIPIDILSQSTNSQKSVTIPFINSPRQKAKNFMDIVQEKLLDFKEAQTSQDNVQNDVTSSRMVPSYSNSRDNTDLPSYLNTIHTLLHMHSNHISDTELETARDDIVLVPNVRWNLTEVPLKELELVPPNAVSMSGVNTAAAEPQRDRLSRPNNYYSRADYSSHKQSSAPT